MKAIRPISSVICCMHSLKLPLEYSEDLLFLLEKHQMKTKQKQIFDTSGALMFYRTRISACTAAPIFHNSLLFLTHLPLCASAGDRKSETMQYCFFVL